MYVPYAIGLVIERVALTFELLTHAILSPRYAIVEWWYDMRSMWS
jgi:hypothetical protein